MRLLFIFIDNGSSKCFSGLQEENVKIEETAVSDSVAIVEELDRWVKQRGSGKYQRDFEEKARYGVPENFGIQQVREEIQEFVGVLLGYPRGVMLEIGLGHFGSTHFLWRLIFEHAATIEKNSARVQTFGANMALHYGKWVLDDGRSSFFYGMSNETSVVRKAFGEFRNGIDALFIDGDHKYESALTDWLLYSPLVKLGGLVAFHDIGVAYERDRGSKGFVEDLEAGKVAPGKKYGFKKIRCSTFGIGYYVKE